MHRRKRLVSPADAAFLVWQVVIPLDFEDRQSIIAEGCQEALLVLDASLCDAVQHRVGALRSLQVVPDGRTFELCEVPALQVADQVCRGTDKTPVDLLHGAMLAGPQREERTQAAVPGGSEARQLTERSLGVDP